MYDVVALGEMLIDFTPEGVGIFKQNPGGAPANVAVAVSKLGGESSFIGCIGDDVFGRYLKKSLNWFGVCSKGLSLSLEVMTTLAFIHLDEEGDRSFSFYRNPGADTRLEIGENDFDIIRNCKVFHFGSLSMTNEPSRSSTFKAVRFAKDLNKIVSYDPNYRPLLWKEKGKAIEEMRKGFQFADIVKLSEEELLIIDDKDHADINYQYSITDVTDAADRLFESGVKLVVVTLGKEGCYYKYSMGSGFIKGFDVETVDTTGCGDAFVGSLLYNISRFNGKGTEDKASDKYINKKINIEDIEVDILEQMLVFSNMVAAICSTKKGAMPAMPSLDDVRLFFK